MPFLKYEKLRQKLEDEETFATTLLVILIDEYGTDMFEWDPDTLVEAAKGTFKAEIPQVNRDKIWGLITVLSTNMFHSDAMVFNAVCQAFNNEESDFEIFNPISLEGAAWGVTEVILNDPESPINDRFSEEVRRYIGVLVDSRGLSQVPVVLSMALPSKSLSEGAAAYANDPEMYAAINGTQQANTDSISEYTKERVRALFSELKGLPLSEPVDLSKFSLRSQLRGISAL